MRNTQETDREEKEVPKEYREAFTFDPDFHGPVKERSCTDVICLFLFLSLLAGWVVVSIFAFRYGNPSLLINPTDSQGNMCGMFNLSSKPYLFFFDLTKCIKPSVVFSGCSTEQVCVSKCPDETWFVTPGQTTEEIKSKLICKYNADMKKTVEKLIEDGDCAAFYLKSTPLVGRCIPELLLENNKGEVIDDKGNPVTTKDKQHVMLDAVKKAGRFLAKFLSTKETTERIFSDLKSSWQIILGILVLAMVASFVWILLMRWIAGIMVYFSILAVMGLLAYGCYYCTTRYIALKSVPDKGVKMAFTLNLSSYLDRKYTWLAFAIICGITFAILFLVILYLRRRINIAIALIREASKAVGCMLSTLLFPFVPYIIQLALIAYFIVVALYISSSGKATYVVYDAQPDSGVKDGEECNPDKFKIKTAKCLFQSYGGTGNLYTSQIYNLFAFLWGIFFIIGVGHVSLAGAFAAYYWTFHKPRDVPFCAVLTGFYRCARFHLGSVAFGSLLIAVVKFIRITLEYIEHKCKKYNNGVTRAIMCCMRCCFWLLDKFIRFITKNAYIMIAIYGKNFCVSAKTAFGLLIRNVVRVFVLDRVTGFLLFIGKLAIVAGAGVASFYIFSGKIEFLKPYVPHVNYAMVPVFVILFGTYAIASIFFNVYEMAVDTLFLCFLEDLERNDGSPEKPYYMSKELMKILNKKNKYQEPRL